MALWRTTQLTPRVRRLEYDPVGRFERMSDPCLSDTALARLGDVPATVHDAAGASEQTPWRVLDEQGAVLAELSLDVDDAGRVRVGGTLGEGESLYGACDADARGLDRRGDLVHLMTEIHPVGRPLLAESEPCSHCATTAEAIARLRSAESEATGKPIPDSNHGELAIPMFLSSHGYGIYISNATSGAVLDLGASDPDRWEFRADRGRADLYILGPGPLPELLKAYHWLTGHQPRPPHWALGYIQSRFGYESFEHARNVVDEFAERDIPLHALVYDVQWLNDYVDLAWHPEAFPEPEAELADMHRKGVRNIVITEPMTRVDASVVSGEVSEHAFALQAASDEPYVAGPWFCTTGIEGYRPLDPCDGRLINFFNDEVGDWWYDHHRHLRDGGVDAWWLDLNEPEGAADDIRFPGADWPARGTLDGRDVRNLLALAQQRQFTRHDRELGHRPLLLTRSGAAGSQRFGASPWTGDIGATWTDLRRQPLLVLNLGMAGIPFAGCDLGGFFGDPGPELFVRFLQAGAVMPAMRAHGCLVDREPWSQGEGAAAHVARVIRFRARLLPQIVSWAYDAFAEGLPLMRPMPLDWPDDERFRNVDDQWMFGALLAAPVLERGATTRTVLLPEGRWLRLRIADDGRVRVDGEPIDGPTSIEVDAALGELPLYAREGTLLVCDPEPMQRRAFEWPPARLEVVPVGSALDGTTATLTLDDGLRVGEAAGEIVISLAARDGSVEATRASGDQERMPEFSVLEAPSR